MVTIGINGWHMMKPLSLNPLMGTRLTENTWQGRVRQSSLTVNSLESTFPSIDRRKGRSRRRAMVLLWLAFDIVINCLCIGLLSLWKFWADTDRNLYVDRLLQLKNRSRIVWTPIEGRTIVEDVSCPILWVYYQYFGNSHFCRQSGTLPHPSVMGVHVVPVSLFQDDAWGYDPVASQAIDGDQN